MMYRQRMQSLMSTQAHVMHIPHLVHRAHSQNTLTYNLHTTSRYMHMCRVYICTPGHLHRHMYLHSQYAYTICAYTVHTFIHVRTFIHAHIILHTNSHTLLLTPSLAQGRVCCVSLQWRRGCPMPLPFPERLDVWKVLFSNCNQHSAGLWRSRAG